uniref:Uncharacterized protein n=1 Tax=Magallana gigas TaxID=29159 RepID=K1PV10_MAGGI
MQPSKFGSVAPIKRRVCADVDIFQPERLFTCCRYTVHFCSTYSTVNADSVFPRTPAVQIATRFKHLSQGLSQLENAGDVDSVLLRCPLLSLSLVVHTQFTRNLIAEIYKKHTNPGLEAMLKITDWVERSRTAPAPLPGELDVNVSMRSAALLSLLHTRSLPSLMEIIRKQARSSEDRQDRVFEGFAVLLVAELIEVKSQFYKEAEQALENLLFSKPELLSYLASNMGEWESMLPQNVLHQMPFTLINSLVTQESSALHGPTSTLRGGLIKMKSHKGDVSSR